MDNLTHTLTAVAMSQAGLNRKTRFATLTLILGANAPDLDILAGLKDGTTYLEYHRGVTHSFLGVVVLALALWGLVYAAGRKVRPKSHLALNARWLLCTAFLGTASHLLLDFTNSYGVRPFLPFSGRWYAWDIMFIFDPLQLTILVLCLGLPWVLRLVSEEVGAGKPHFAAGGILALSALVVLWGVRDFAHRSALSTLDSRTYSEQNPLRIGAFPSSWNPLEWTGVVETETAFHVLHVNVADPDQLDLRTFNKPEPSPALSAAMTSRTGRIFMDFARFPWGEVDQSEEGFLVSLRDLRFYRGPTPARSFVADFQLDKNLGVRSDSFHFTAPLRRREE